MLRDKSAGRHSTDSWHLFKSSQQGHTCWEFFCLRPETGKIRAQKGYGTITQRQEKVQSLKGYGELNKAGRDSGSGERLGRS